jgi:uncharacterized membrane protein
MIDQTPHVLYLGDWVFHTGPMYIETPFGMEMKDCDLHFYGRRLSEALKPKAELTCMANWELYRLEPGRFEELMHRSQTLIISDVEARCFHLYPGFFDRAKRERRVVTFPDRLASLKKWIAEGGGLMMMGGWLSFSGVGEKGGWRRSLMAEALPVECLVGEDLVESSSGFTVEVLNPSHPIARGLPWHSFPPLFGYNELRPKPDSEVIVRIRETGHPLIVTGGYKDGRIFVYASDPAPHWGLNVEMWEGYDSLWQQALNWVRKQD